jgi:NAD(P)-dependent dehydrogenase (short-subunit alcohol dehydrogenase family)
MDGQVWLVTGGARGLGRAFVNAAVAAGHRVAVTMRDVGNGADLLDQHGDRVLLVQLDVQDRAEVFAAVRSVIDHFGSIEVLVNNAGYVLAGGVEEVSEAEVRHQFDVNLFGALWCTQAVLPFMRRQHKGHIFQISSLGAVVASTNISMYCSTKWALEGFSEALASEIAGFGIGVTIVELSAFRTDWNGSSMTRAAPMPEYDDVLGARREAHSGIRAHTSPGDPQRAAAALIEVLESDSPPRRLLLGNAAVDVAMQTLRDRQDECLIWETLSRSVDFER